VAVRARALRPSYDPAQLTAGLARAAARALDQGTRPGASQGTEHGASPGTSRGASPGTGPGARPGPDWVIPQVRWLHEADRLCPAGGGPPDPGRYAPPLNYRLPGLADWPGARVGHRLRALRRHPLSMDLAGNRQAAWTALLGEDDQRAFGLDLATLGVGLPPSSQLSHVAAPLGVTAWLAVVLSWPRRLVVAQNHSAAWFAGDAPGGNPG
jgi:uncharacterized protein